MTDHDTYCVTIGVQTAALADVLDVGDLTRAVPTTPGWDVQAVVKHLGVIQRWAAQMTRDGLRRRLDFREVEGRAPADGQSWADWLRAGGELAVEQMRAHPAETPVWTWGPGGTVGWWARRLTYETFVHRSDVVLAMGGTPELSPDLAVDGVDEFLDNLRAAAAFAPAVADLRGAGESVHLHATDAEGEWMLTLTPDGFTAEHGHGKGDVAVRGSAVDLLLLVYGRRSGDDPRLERFGDPAVLDRWLTHAAI